MAHNLFEIAYDTVTKGYWCHYCELWTKSSQAVHTALTHADRG